MLFRLCVQRSRRVWSLRVVLPAMVLLLIISVAHVGFAQTSPPLSIFQNYFVTGDYVVAGWVEGAPDGSPFAPGKISVPDTLQPDQTALGVPRTVPKGADIVAAYLYWATVEGSQSSFAGQQAFFNGYTISGTVLGNPNAPVSWSSGGCSGASQGSKTMRTYRADVRPYLPLDLNPNSTTFGAIDVTNGGNPIAVRLADSGSNGNTAPFALGASLIVIYRVLSPATPLNAIVLYDGAFAPSNSSATMSQLISGFYDAATSPVAKITQIVANGQPNKSEQVFLNNTSQPLPSLYGSFPPFPGIYNQNGSAWDNPTWVLNHYGSYVNAGDGQETTSVIPSSSNSGCVSWGAIILSSTVQDTDGDGLLDSWESANPPGYTDAVSNQWVALPGASPNVKDLFVEVDYLSNLDSSAGPYLHSHLPKQAALDAAGGVFVSKNINVHFDLGPGIYASDPYVIQYPVAIPNPLPAGTLSPQAGTGGNAISEGLLVCTDGTTLCAFPGISTIAWKGGFLFVRDSATMPNTTSPLGNFQPGRGQSYHYVLFGHSLGASRSVWNTYVNALAQVNPGVSQVATQLVSISNSGTTATVTIQSPTGVVKPGDCPNAAIPACSDTSAGRVSITGALGQPNLNGTYIFSNPQSSTTNGITTTTFTITTANVASGTYTFNNEPELAVNYLGPTSNSGYSDFGGGADTALTLGGWEADDPAGCQADPSQPLGSVPAYCNNQTGSVAVQEGTLLHELGHTLTLTHGGTYYNNPNNPSLASYEPNCKPNFLSVMNYLFQVRGFPDGGYDYSGQNLLPLSENSLDESIGLGLSPAAAHITRWYAPPNALDKKLQSTVGGRYATFHCDGTPITDGAQMVKVDGSTFSSPIDWNNDLIVPDAVGWQDVNFNGSTQASPDDPFSGFNDWNALDLTQIGARAGAFDLSGGGGTFLKGSGGTFLKGSGGTFLNEGGGTFLKGSGGTFLKGSGGTFLKGSGGIEQDSDTANSTADPATGLTAVLGNKSVVLNWTAPSFGQIRKYYIWRAVGSFTTLQSVQANISAFSNIKTLTGTPPSTTFTDTTVKNNTTYTYFVSDANKLGVQSGPSNPAVVFVKF